MVYDTLDNFFRYASLHPFFYKVDKFLNITNLFDLEPGKHEIYEDCYAGVSEYMSKSIDECFIECHRKYIDIQIVLKGREMIGVCSKNFCHELEYDAERDFQVLRGDVDLIKMDIGRFAIFFPNDGHMPQIKMGGDAEEIKKLVIKVPVL